MKKIVIAWYLCTVASLFGMDLSSAGNNRMQGNFTFDKSTGSIKPILVPEKSADEMLESSQRKLADEAALVVSRQDALDHCCACIDRFQVKSGRDSSMIVILLQQKKQLQELIAGYEERRTFLEVQISRLKQAQAESLPRRSNSNVLLAAPIAALNFFKATSQDTIDNLSPANNQNVLQDQIELSVELADQGQDSCQNGEHKKYTEEEKALRRKLKKARIAAEKALHQATAQTSNLQSKVIKTAVKIDSKTRSKQTATTTLLPTTSEQKSQQPIQNISSSAASISVQAKTVALASKSPNVSKKSTSSEKIATPQQKKLGNPQVKRRDEKFDALLAEFKQSAPVDAVIPTSIAVVVPTVAVTAISVLQAQVEAAAVVPDQATMPVDPVLRLEEFDKHCKVFQDTFHTIVYGCSFEYSDLTIEKLRSFNTVINAVTKGFNLMSTKIAHNFPEYESEFSQRIKACPEYVEFIQMRVKWAQYLRQSKEEVSITNRMLSASNPVEKILVFRAQQKLETLRDGIEQVVQNLKKFEILKKSS